MHNSSYLRDGVVAASQLLLVVVLVLVVVLLLLVLLMMMMMLLPLQSQALNDKHSIGSMYPLMVAKRTGYRPQQPLPDLLGVRCCDHAERRSSHLRLSDNSLHIGWRCGCG